MKYRILFLFLLTSFIANAQENVTHNEAPSPVELNIGNNRFGLQFLMNKHFTPESKFSFLSVTSFESTYNNDINNLDFINNSQVSYEIYKGFGVATGISVNRVSGLTPIVGLEYVFVNKEILLVLTPTYHLSKNKNIEGLALIEYKPKLTEKINLYTRFQTLYNYNSENNQHERSYMQFRLGVGISNYQFGLTTNLDYYGAAKILKENYGVFLRFNFK
ncbi:hypothetical protein N6B72_03610 [Chryseobacterium soli]|uniref:hypothetical protein n=1 Tax=Chryseobacterium soli TaxID=445961 RepID=UPI0029557B21|nr:hypothetical protein [Chryseobacterium soli]MDV7696000.1 hypothetical protein [Chryseobacterium soli]